MASITWTKDGQTEELQFVENPTGNYFVDSNDVVVAPFLASLDSAAAGLITAAVAHSNKLRLPAGTHYSSKVTGTLFNLASHDGLEIYGDGKGRTIIQFTDNLTLTGDVFVFSMAGNNQSVHDLTILNGANMSGGAFDDWAGVTATGAYHPHIYEVEVAGVYGASTAGGVGIQLYQPRTAVETVTTLGTTISGAGSHIFTPASMDGIYLGQRLGIDLSDVTNIESADEQVIVTAKTATTATATFAHAHASSVTIGTPARGNMYALVEDCIVRDSYQATAYGCSGSQNSVFRRCIAKNVGAAAQQHGFYIQGNVLLEDCYCEGIYGYSYHLHMQAPNLDASGVQMRNCVSVNPGSSHGIIDSVGASDGTNYDVPAPFDLNRYASVIGCTFRCTRGAGANAAGFSSSVMTLVEGCTFEDACMAGSSPWLDLEADYSIATGNHFRYMLSTSNGTTLRTSLGSHCTASNNTIYNLTGIATIGIGTYSQASGNTLYGASITAVAHSRVFGNVITVPNIGDRCLVTGGITNLDVHDNTLSNAAGPVWEMYNADTGRFYRNTIAAGYVLYHNPTAGMLLDSNVGLFSQDSNAAITLTGEEGRLTWFTSSAGAQPSGGYGTVLAAGLAQRATTGSTVLAGIGIGDTSAGQGTWLVSSPGAIVSVIMDAAWTVGNVALPSTGTAGKWKDSLGTTQPAYRASYGILLNSGGGAGTARMLIVQLG